MNQRFVIGINVATVEQDKSFKEILGKTFPGAGWWHWLPNIWLLSYPRGGIAIKELRRIAMEAYPGQNLIVLELPKDGDNWSGFGPSVESSYFAWLRENWQ